MASVAEDIVGAVRCLDDELDDEPASCQVAVPQPVGRQPMGLSMEASYILDCAVELGEITPFEALAFHLDAPAAGALVAVLDRGEQLPPHWLRNTARQHLQSLPLEQRYIWALQGLAGAAYGLEALQGRIEFLVQSKVQSDLGVVERAHISWMDEGTTAVFQDKAFLSVHDVTQERVTAFVASCFGDTRSRLEEDFRLALEAARWVSQPEGLERARLIAAKTFRLAQTMDAPANAAVPWLRLARGSARRMRQAQREARSAIKKAFRLFTRAGMEDNVRMLVKGQEVEVAHPESPFKFVLQPLQPGWLEQKTANPGAHVPYQLTLLTKDDVFLSRLCVLFDATPVLDQLLALTLFVQSGNEQDLLSKANWFGYEDAARVREVLAVQAPALVDKVPAPKCASQGGVRGLELIDQAEAHWSPYRGPVKNWVAAWLDELRSSYAALAPMVAALQAPQAAS